MTFLKLGGPNDKLDAQKFVLARGCDYKNAALSDSVASVKELKDLRDLDYSVFTIETSNARIAGVHIHCDSYGPWGAFHKTVRLLKEAKSKEWPLQVIFVVGCCGASTRDAGMKQKIPCGTVLVATGVNCYLPTGKVKPADGGKVVILSNPHYYEVTTKWLQALKAVSVSNARTGFNDIKVMEAMYLSGPLVIKDQLFGANYLGAKDFAGVEMEVTGVIEAMRAIHKYTGNEDLPKLVLAKGVSDHTDNKEEDNKCMFFGKETAIPVNDDTRQVYATLQSIALVIRSVVKYRRQFPTAQ